MPSLARRILLAIAAVAALVLTFFIVFIVDVVRSIAPNIEEEYALQARQLVNLAVLRDPNLTAQPLSFSTDLPRISNGPSDYCELDADGMILVDPQHPCWTVKSGYGPVVSQCTDTPFWSARRTCIDLYAPYTLANNAELVEFIFDVALNPCAYEESLEPPDQPHALYVREAFLRFGGHNCDLGEPRLEVYLVFLDLDEPPTSPLNQQSFTPDATMSIESPTFKPPIVLRTRDFVRRRSPS